MDSVKQKWQSLSTREQLYVSVGSVVIIAALLYYLVVAPLMSSVANLKQQFTDQQDLVAWMTPRVAALQQLQTTIGSQPVATTNLLATVDTQLKQSNLASAVGEISQTNTNQVRITLKEVSFDELMSWLVQEWQQSQIQVSDFVAQRTDKPGMVTVTMTLSATA